MNAVFDRVNRVEREVAQVREELAGITVNLNGLSATLSRMAISMEQKGATDWKAIWSAATVILAVISLAATLILGPMRTQIVDNAERIDRVTEDRIVQVRQQLVDAQEVGRYRERVDRIDKELDRLLEERRRAAGVP